MPSWSAVGPSSGREAVSTGAFAAGDSFGEDSDEADISIRLKVVGIELALKWRCFTFNTVTNDRILSCMACSRNENWFENGVVHFDTNVLFCSLYVIVRVISVLCIIIDYLYDIYFILIYLYVACFLVLSRFVGSTGIRFYRSYSSPYLLVVNVVRLLVD